VSAPILVPRRRRFRRRLPAEFPPDIRPELPGRCLRRGGSEGKFALVAPHAAPGADHHVGYSGCLGIRYSDSARETGSFFTIEVILQDDAAVAKVVAQTEQVIALAADQSHQKGMTCM